MRTFRRGRDSNHVDTAVVPAPGALLVDAAYHALHHAYPDRYMSSFTTVFDRLAGTGCALAGRRVAMTGATGALGAPLKEMLEREGAQVTGLRFNVDYTYDDYGRLDAALQCADILVLAHGSKKDHAMDANSLDLMDFVGGSVDRALYVMSTAGRWLEVLDRSEWLCAGYPLIVWLAFGLLALVLACSGPVPPRPPSPTVPAKAKTVRPPRISAPVLSRRLANAACYRRRDLSRPSGAGTRPSSRLIAS
ncbi:hypothetical protein [Sorangium sp. So ce1097]|uniref:hypothetical protein n=1 Tax=Sorangium sp. So ce1097 TaxID=3133330 RepID=UPI003F5F6854